MLGTHFVVFDEGLFHVVFEKAEAERGIRACKRRKQHFAIGRLFRNALDGGADFGAVRLDDPTLFAFLRTGRAPSPLSKTPPGCRESSLTSVQIAVLSIIARAAVAALVGLEEAA